MIAVTGANGKLGQLTIQNLLKTVKPSEVIAIVRNPEKAEHLSKLGIILRKGDYDQPVHWEEAFKGVKKLLLISSSAVGKRINQHKTVIDAAKKAQVEHLIYTSTLNADTSTMILAQEHVETEKAIKSSGLSYTILRNGWYFENDTDGLKHASQSGSFANPANDGRLSSAARSDYAEAAAVVLTTSGHLQKVYELAGDSSFTMNDLAREASEQSNTAISYKYFPVIEYKDLLMGFGLEEVFSTAVADAYFKASKGELFSNSKDLSELIGRPTTTLAIAVANALK